LLPDAATRTHNSILLASSRSVGTQVKKTHTVFPKVVEELMRALDVAVKAGAAQAEDPAQRDVDALGGYCERIQEIVCPEIGNM
jgi:hypothetical protein